MKKLFLEIPQNSIGKHLCQGLFFIKKEALAQVFSCEFCQISKNIFFAERLRATASKYIKLFDTRATI